ncbi:cytochrome c peroxidase, partial [Moniliophthora roreri]
VSDSSIKYDNSSGTGSNISLGYSTFYVTISIDFTNVAQRRRNVQTEVRITILCSSTRSWCMPTMRPQEA